MRDKRAVCRLFWFLSVLSVSSVANQVHAHPVPREAHDRNITVRLTPEAVIVAYHLEVDPWTIIFRDVPALSDVDTSKLTKVGEFCEVFTRGYAPILADRLVAKLDGKLLDFTCVKHGHQLKDSAWCDFVFQARWKPEPGKQHTFTFREGNYEYQAGQIVVTVTNTPATPFLEKVEADEVLKEKQKKSDEERLRTVSATFEVVMMPPKDRPSVGSLEASGMARSAPAEDAEPGTILGKETSGEATAKPLPETKDTSSKHWSSPLLELLDSQHGFWVLLWLAVALGAVHALTPGHGKTLVAAYLIGERGTVWHALLLGLTTTLTHTGTVIAVAVALVLFFPQAAPEKVQTALELGGGLLVAGLGLWLLMRRLSGRADHFHLPGHGHHHDHHAADHYHDEHGHAHPLPAEQRRVSLWGLIGMGISGGIVPCWDAIFLLGFAIITQRLWLAVPLLLAFSAGLAGVLVVIGMAVVYAKGFASAGWGESRLVRALPVVSAALITVLGLWLCYDSVQARPEVAPLSKTQP